MNEHNIVLSIVTVAGLGVGAQWLAWRLKMPAIVLLAAVGLIMGPGLDLIHPSQDFGDFLQPVVSLCVAMEVQIMNEEKDVEFTSSQRILDPEAGGTIVYFARAEYPQTSETADAPVG